MAWSGPAASPRNAAHADAVGAGYGGRAGEVSRGHRPSPDAMTGPRTSRRPSPSSASSRRRTPTRPWFRLPSRAETSRLSAPRTRGWADRAIAAADAARALDPALPEVETTLGEVYLDTGDEGRRAGVSTRPGGRPGSVPALLGLGRANELAGDSAAAERLSPGDRLEPSFAVFNQLALLYFDLGRYTEAADMFRRAARAAPDSARALSDLGGTEPCSATIRPRWRHTRKRSRSTRATPAPSSNLGMTQLWTGRAAEAVASLERAARQKANDYRSLATSATPIERPARATRPTMPTPGRTPSPARNSASTPATRPPCPRSPPRSRRRVSWRKPAARWNELSPSTRTTLT